MRLRRVLSILEASIPRLKPRTRLAKLPDGTPGRQVALNDTHSALDDLRQIPGYAEEVDRLRQSNPYLRDAPSTVTLDRESADGLEAALQAFAGSLTSTTTALRTALPSQDPHSLIVQLPDRYRLSEVAGFIGDLEGVLARVGAGSPTSVTVQNFDSGSLLLEIVGQIISPDSETPGQGAAQFLANTFVLWGFATLATRTVREIRGVLSLLRRDQQLHRARGIVVDDAEDQAQLERMLRDRIRQQIAEERSDFSPEQLNNFTDLTVKLSMLSQAGMQLMLAENAPEPLKRLADQPSAAEFKAIEKLLLTQGRLVQSSEDKERDE